MNLIQKIALTFLLTFSFSFSFAQSGYKTDYLGIGTGINSVGFIGLTYEHIFKDRFGVYTNLGLGGWGYKAGIGGRYYFRDAVSGGIAVNFSRALGANGIESELPVIQNGREVTRTIQYDANPVNVFNLSYVKFWRMGRNSRFNLEFGYSIPLNGKSESNYTIKTPGVTLAESAKNALVLVQPGGIVIGLGFTFGL